jgi:hypothetical protein
MKTIMFFIVFLLIGAFFIVSNENLRMNKKDNVRFFFKSYGNWFDDLFDNGGQIAGYVVKMNWLPDEQLANESLNIS